MMMTAKRLLKLEIYSKSVGWESFLRSASRCQYSTSSAAFVEEDGRSGQDNPYFEDFHANHISANPTQKFVLSTGSALITLFNPARPDALGVFGETSGGFALQKMHAKMMSSEEGRSILMEKPRISTKSVNLEELKKLPQNCLGQAYVKFLKENNVSPDTRTPVQFVDDIELAYVMQRYREIHDLVHTVLGMPTNMLGEVAVKWVEGIQTGLPMCISGALLGPLRLMPKQRQRYLKHYLPWALSTARNSEFLLNVYFEKRWEQPMEELLKYLRIEKLEESSD